MFRRDDSETSGVVKMAGKAIATAFLFLAAASPARAQSPFDAFVARSSDPQPTLRLEKAAAAALSRNDRGWFAAAPRREERPLNRALSAIEATKQNPPDATKVGPCNVAWLTLRSWIVRTSGDARALPKNAQLSEAAPQDIANMFAENMNRCELVKRLPRTRRLIGVDANRT